MRYFLISLLVLLVIGPHAVLSEPVADCCEHDETTSPGGCQDSCPLCVCCLASRPIDRTDTDGQLLVLAPEPVLTPDTAAPTSPEPSEILHVPKPLFA